MTRKASQQNTIFRYNTGFNCPYPKTEPAKNIQ